MQIGLKYRQNPIDFNKKNVIIIPHCRYLRATKFPYLEKGVPMVTAAKMSNVPLFTISLVPSQQPGMPRGTRRKVFSAARFFFPQ
jgi:hypothetical protein